MSERTEVIGIDFGTTHTHVSIGSAISKETRSLGKGWPSAILYWNGDYAGCGDEALEEFVDYANDGHYDLRINFKPEIGHDEKAGETAALFLREITRDIPDKTSMKTLVGVPAGASEDFKDALKKLMRGAFGDVETISEPLGALVNFQESGRLPNRELIDDLLVIDFGGGTCDFAYTRGGKVHSVPLEKGNYYGGRLFDDLFFQWWEESNPGEAQKCPENDKAIIFLKKSRDAKEAFSIRMANNRDAKFDCSQFLKHGALRNLTWADFVKRAQNYCPSERLLKSTKIRLADFGAMPGDSINLLEQFYDLLKGAIKDYSDSNGPDARFKWVLLAGGSSLWPFVKDGVKEILNVFDDNILIDPDPYATIALGLAQIPYRREVLAGRKYKLEKLFSGSEGKIGKIIDVCLGMLKSNFAASCAGDLDSIWSTIVKPVVLGHIEGKIDAKALKKQLEAKKYEIQGKMMYRLEEQSEKVLEFLRGRVQKELQSEADANNLSNNLTLPQRLQVDLSGVPLDEIFYSLLPEESKISVFTSIVNMLLMPFRLFVSFFERKAKRAEKERKKLKEAQTQFKEKAEGVIEDFFTRSYAKHKLLEQIKAPVKLAIDNIELLQSQI